MGPSFLSRGCSAKAALMIFFMLRITDPLSVPDRNSFWLVAPLASLFPVWGTSFLSGSVQFSKSGINDLFFMLRIADPLSVQDRNSFW